MINMTAWIRRRNDNMFTVVRIESGCLINFAIGLSWDKALNVLEALAADENKTVIYTNDNGCAAYIN